MRQRKAAQERRTIGYIRVSTQEQARDGVSLAAQEERIRAFAVATSRPLCEVVVDDGASAASLKRNGLQDILAQIREGSIGAVVVAKLDRLTRSVRDLLDLLEVFEKHGVALVSISETLDTSSAMGRCIIKVIGSFSELEREQGGERTSDALAELRRTGKAYGPTPFGWHRQGDDLVADPEQQAWLTKAREMSAAGATLQQIADQFNAAGVARPRAGRKWYPSSVRSILNSKAAVQAA
jgi:DNA invertase Pin-like site-specific DNA recombinase